MSGIVAVVCTPFRLAAALVMVVAVLAAPTQAYAEAFDVAMTDRLKEMSLEQLINIEVSSVSRKAEPRLFAPAAVAVITGDDIRRSGARSLVEALRMAPGVFVGRSDSNDWATGIRGFPSTINRNMLVLMDGRSVYTPLFAGVYWHAQDTLLEDVDRIEVIRGPGGTLWGANAVNGVVNITTKSSDDTRGSFLEAGGGNEERAFAGYRQGGSVGKTGSYRIYAKGFNREGGFRPDDNEFDEWWQARAGFRSDWHPVETDTVTVQGDIYTGDLGERLTITSVADETEVISDRDADIAGGNLLARWSRALGDGSDVRVQAYYDRTERKQANFREDRDTGDIELQHRFKPHRRHEIVWGAGYRYTSDSTGGPDSVQFVPDHRGISLLSAFVQDEITVVPDLLRFTAGTKVEHNSLSGFEFQPSARALVTPHENHTVWAAVSRAVRTPSRLDHDLEISFSPMNGTVSRLLGTSDFDSEELLAYEAGYRVRALDNLFVDVAGFYNDYDELTSIRAGAPFAEGPPGQERTVIPLVLANDVEGETYGGELAADLEVNPSWRLRSTYSYVRVELDVDPVAIDNTASSEKGTPRHMVSLRSQLDLSETVQLDAMIRYVDKIPASSISSYIGADVRLAWQVSSEVELAVVGQNLAEDHHREFGTIGVGGSEVERGLYGQVTWRR